MKGGLGIIMMSLAILTALIDYYAPVTSIQVCMGEEVLINIPSKDSLNDSFQDPNESEPFNLRYLEEFPHEFMLKQEQITRCGEGIKPEPLTPGPEDWVITGNETRRDEVIILMGNLIVESGGNLTLINVTLYMKCYYNGELQIRVKSGGRLNILRSTIAAYDPEHRFLFYIENDSVFRMYDSELHGCGYDDLHPGLWIGTGDAIMRNCTITENWYGVYCYSSKVNMSGCVISDGVYCYNSTLILDNCSMLDEGGYSLRCTMSTINIYYCEVGGGVYSLESVVMVNDSYIHSSRQCGVWSTQSKLIIHNSTIRGFGTGIYCNKTSTIMYNCSISGHGYSYYNGYGYGIYCLSSELFLRKCLVSGRGCGAASSYDATHGYGHGIYSVSSCIIITDCHIYGTAYGSFSSYGYGVYSDSSTIYITNYSKIYGKGEGYYDGYGYGVYSICSNINIMNHSQVVGTEGGIEIGKGYGLISESSFINVSLCTVSGSGSGYNWGYGYGILCSESAVAICNSYINGIGRGGDAYGCGIHCDNTIIQIIGNGYYNVTSRAIPGYKLVGWGYGIYCTHSNVRIIGYNIKVKGDPSFGCELGIYVVNSNLTIAGCSLRSVHKGICIKNSNAIVRACNVEENIYGIHCINSHVNISMCKITRNEYGIYCDSTLLDVHYCNIYSNNHHGLYGKGSCFVNATYNWWNSTHGPDYKKQGDSTDPEEVYNENGPAYLVIKPFLSEPVIIPLSIVVTPFSGKYVRDVVMLVVCVLFPSDINRVELYIDDELIFVDNIPPPYIMWNTTHYADGTHTVLTIAYSKNGLITEDQVEVIVDNTSPIVEITGLNPGDFICGYCVVRIYGSDANLECINLYVDGSLITSWFAEGNYTWTIDTCLLVDGSHNITAEAVDKAGNTVENIIIFHVDNTPPKGEITIPSSYLRGLVRIEILAEDAHLNMVKLYINSEVIDILTKTEAHAITYVYRWNTTEYPDGKYHIKLVVKDKAGNVFESSTNVIVDNTAPSIGEPTISPESPTEEDDVTVKVSMTDVLSGVKEAVLSYSTNGGATWSNVTMTLGPYGYYTATIPRQLAGATVLYKIYALDEAGNQAVSPEYSYTVRAKPTLMRMLTHINGELIMVLRSIPLVGDVIMFLEALVPGYGALTFMIVSSLTMVSSIAVPVRYWKAGRSRSEKLLKLVRRRRQYRFRIDYLVSKTGLDERKVEQLLTKLLKNGQLTGILDRGAGIFIYIPRHKIEAIFRLIESKGAVSLRELANKFNLTERELRLLITSMGRD